MNINIYKDKCVSKLSDREVNTLRGVAFLIPFMLLLYSYCNQDNVPLIGETWLLRIGISITYIIGLVATFFSDRIKRNFPTVLFVLGFPLFFSLSMFLYLSDFDPTRTLSLTLVCAAYCAIFNKKTHLILHLGVHLLFMIGLLLNVSNAGTEIIPYIFTTVFTAILFYFTFAAKIQLVNELRGKNQLMEKVFEDATDALLLFDTEKQIFTNCNAKSLKLFNVKSKNALLNNSWELLGFFQKQCLAIKSNLALEATWRKEMQLEQTKLVWVELIVNEMSEIENLLLIRVVDITDRKAAEYAWEMTQFTIDQVSDILFWTTKEGFILYANDAASSVLGYAKEELRHMSIYEIEEIRTKHIQREIEAFWKHLKEQKELNIKTKYKTKAGELIAVEVTSNYLNFRGKEYNCAFVRNISETTSMLTRIKASEERFRSIFEDGPLGMVLLDMNHRITNVNDTFCQLLGYGKAEIADKPLNDIIHVDDRVPEQDILEYYQQEEEQLSKGIKVEKRYLKKNGTILWVMLTSTIIKGKYVLAMLEDINSRKKAQEALKIYAHKLENSNKELEQFAYVVSHDLQEPLRMVSSYLQLLERRYGEKLDESGIDFINYAVDGAQRMSGLIQDLLQYSRVSTRGKAFKSSNCNEIMLEVLTNLQTAISESGAKIIYQSLPTIHADSMQLSQLFQNLIGNAIKYRSEDYPIIEIDTTEQEEHWLFSVKDNGIGIEKDYLQQIFGVFQRLHTRNEFEGSGIGLAICQRIVNRHDGEIWAESEVGKGATFYFTIPK